ncbi:MAG: UDP-N-acetylmuramoyl-L-alanyl-D-glutamate--2,6-diaminopimelate ligase [Bryobacteraceae bacterium]|nr:UDP-N-acetylmuramoyl-L-alanyl-D-glutamate--2,6-diaminopimelate ligase [Bryobacteraceae bacterium]
MTLADLLADTVAPGSLPREDAMLDVLGLDYDSRRIGPGHVFFAFRGAKEDGTRFAAGALEKGAIAVVSEEPAPRAFPAPWIRVEHGRRSLALAARRFYASAKDIAATGITGTNGKTTTAYLVDSIFRQAHSTTLLVGTIEYRLAGVSREAVNTTPESLDLYRLFAELTRAGGGRAVMEVSSHALAQGRVWGIPFQAAVFTNLTQDHLDFHGTMESYFRAKCALFEGQGAAPPAHSIVNFDDDYGRRIRVARSSRAWWFGLSPGASIRAEKIASGFDGLRFDVQHDRGTLTIASPLVGRVNIYNILAAVSVGLAYGLSVEAIERGIALCAAVPGRFERVAEGQPFLVVVDYAHTPDALRNVILAARALKPERVITLFGCGGERDRAKRPLMGAAAAELSDYVVVTSDNPRSEDPDAIIDDILPGLAGHRTDFYVEADRSRAIAHALSVARPGDIVLLAGKGHETYQILPTGTVHFDDREVARAHLRAAGRRAAG